jgi:acetyl-CoA carboxylase biotin carboxyl carrier protein
MSDSPSSSQSVFDVERIRQLVELMKESGLSEVDLKQGEQAIRLKRGPDPAATAPVYALPPNPAPSAAAPPQPAAPTPAASEAGVVVIKSPMVGTFYSRPNPNAPPYVKVGDRVTPETIVCVVEAMKTFTEIPAEVSGQIVAVLVGDEEPVDFGKPLFKVDTKK